MSSSGSISSGRRIICIVLTAVILFLDLAYGEAANHNASLVEDDGNGETSQTVPVTTTQQPSDMDFILKKDNKTCLKATFHATFKIKYPSGTVKSPLQIKETIVDLPPVVNVSGSCSSAKSDLILSWNDGNFSLRIIYTPEDRKTSKDGKLITEGWSAAAIEFTVDTKDSKLFTTPLYPGRYIVSTASKSTHFWAARNHSFECKNSQRTILLEYDSSGSEIQENIVQVVMDTTQQRVQPFDMPPNGEFSPSTECDIDVFITMPKQSVVPVVIAAILALVIIVIVIAYIISKNMNRSPYRGIE